jgi:hypothetical protein
MNTGIGTGILPPTAPFAELLLALGRLAVDQAQQVARRRKEARRPRKGASLRPGDETPLWNAVVERVRPHLRTRGAKANLARVLEVPRQRVHDYFVAGTQMPDAERMIHVLLWLSVRESGADNPAAIQSPKPLN